MRKLLLRIFRGRYGAYGSDTLTRFLLTLTIITLLLSITADALSFLYYIAIVLVVFSYYRLFSKKITKRYKENEAFEKLIDKLFGIFKKK